MPVLPILNPAVLLWVLKLHFNSLIKLIDMQNRFISGNRYFKPILGLVLIISVISCKKNYLGVSDKLAPELTTEKVFSDPTLTRQFHANIFSGMPILSGIILDLNSAGITWIHNPWPALSDEIKTAHGSTKDVALNGYNSGNAGFGRWVPLYRLIRQANVFLENAKPIPQTGLSDFISEDEMRKMKNNARFFRAYYHYLLFEQYGPIVIMDKTADPNNPALDFARNSVDEVVKFISDELTEILPGLDDTPPRPEERAVPTKGVALAVKAKLLVYAASPLYNGGFAEALALKNKDGKSLFPAANPAKWTTAKAALEEFLNFASGKYDLYRPTASPDENLYRLFIDVEGNNEIIWANPLNLWGSVNGDGTDRRCFPRSERAGFASVGVTQQLVDDFFMRDGLSISESPLYSENGFSVAGDDPTGRTEVGTFKMWVNREPRFYQTVFYQDRRWPTPNTNILQNAKIQFHRGSANDNANPNNPYTGYLLYKRVARNVRDEGSFPRSQYRPSIIFRLAEFYLLYAEVCNEVNPADPKIFEYIDKVRERAGIPKLADIKPGLLGNKDELRKAIQRESRVELCIEGQRYFDVRRWMIAQNPIGQGGQSGAFTGMNMNSPNLTIGSGGFFARTTFENRTFLKAMYFYPIPLDEIQKSKLLVQNPLW
jgi:hypothetical protein